MKTSAAALPKRLATFVLLLFLSNLLIPGLASAQVSGRLSVGNLSFALTDLNPSDGISPSLVFQPLPYVPPTDQQFYGATLRADFIQWPGAGQESITLYGTGTESLTHAYLVSDTGWMTASLSGREQVGTHLIEVEAYARTEGKVRESSNGWIDTGYFPFILSPNTAVVFTVEVRVIAGVTQRHLKEEYFEAVAYLVADLGDPLAAVIDQELYYARPELWTGTEASLDVSDMLHVTVENIGDTYVSGNVNFVGSAGALSNMAPGIPEPGMLPMLTIGLCVAGFWRWKQSQFTA